MSWAEAQAGESSTKKEPETEEIMTEYSSLHMEGQLLVGVREAVNGGAQTAASDPALRWGELALSPTGSVMQTWLAEIFDEQQVVTTLHVRAGGHGRCCQ